MNISKRPSRASSPRIFIMKSIWQKYKIWLLIAGFYAVYSVLRIFKMLKHIGTQKIKLDTDREKLKCG